MQRLRAGGARMTNSMVNLTARVSHDVLDRLDELARQAGQTRSEYLRDLVEQHLDGPDDTGRDHEFGAEFFAIKQELATLKQAVGQVLVTVLMNMPDEGGSRLAEAEARDLVAHMLRLGRDR
ncbi:MAG: ribbon-helix-helix protein, CopG family [Phycisphaerales bacterium JB052]